MRLSADSTTPPDVLGNIADLAIRDRLEKGYTWRILLNIADNPSSPPDVLE